MTELLTRRRFINATAAGLTAMPLMIRAQTGSQTVIEGRTFRGTRPAGGTGPDGGTALASLLRRCRHDPLRS